jgi:hypothetical protein
MHRQNRLLRLSSLIAGLALALLAFYVPSFGQTSDKQLATALAEITLLKQVIAEQDRRITDLEKALRTLQGTPARPTPSSSTAQALGRQATVGQPSSDSWKALEAPLTHCFIGGGAARTGTGPRLAFLCSSASP